MKKWKGITVLTAALCLALSAHGAGIFRVDAASTAPAPDGQTWETAYPTLQAGAWYAADAGGGEVWVRAGIYTSSNDPVVRVWGGTELYGGFGGNETTREQRDWTANATIIDGEGAKRCVVGHQGRLDGFTVRNGSEGLLTSPWAGIGANFLVENCVFGGNTSGGAVENYAYGEVYNQVVHRYPCKVTFRNCSFVGNYSAGNGGAVFNGAFWNLRDSSVASAQTLSCDVRFSRCVFQGNTSGSSAGIFGSSNGFTGFPTNVYTELDHCTLYATNIGSSSGGAPNATATVKVTNSILWAGSNILDTKATYTVTQSCLESLYPGAGNIFSDPLFVAAPENLRLRGASPCIGPGAGDDMGAYEWPSITGSISINGGSSYTTNPAVMLSLGWSSLTGSPVSQMCFSDDGVHWSSWEPVAATRPYTLPGSDGYHTVRVQFRDGMGEVSGQPSAYILLDATPPVGTVVINNGDESTNWSTVVLALSASDGAGTGVGYMQFSNNGTNWSSWEAFDTWKVWSLSGGNGPKTVHVRFKDKAGLVSNASATDSIVLDSREDADPPTGTIVINGGAEFTNETNVYLALSANDGAGSGVMYMQFSADGTIWTDWELYATGKAWTLPAANGLYTVHVRYRDLMGNVSAVDVADTIQLDLLLPANVCAVDPSSTAATPDGRTWGRAYRDIQSAVNGRMGTFWIKEGTYTGSSSAVIYPQNAILYGGFAGNEGALDQRDWTKHPTVIDGENQRQCISGGYLVMDGLTITRGKGNIGGGVYSGSMGWVDAVNCIFTLNTATTNGGGMGTDNSSCHFEITNCTFSNNSAGGSGGGVYNTNTSFVTKITDCVFSENTSAKYGGGLYVAYGILTGVAFQGNTAKYGGGMYSAFFLNATNCIFKKNVASLGGGFCSLSSPKLFNCTFAQNVGIDYGGGIYNGGTSGTVEVTNCILWGDSAPAGAEIHDNSKLSVVATSCVQGGYAGTGNINADPMFVGAPDNLRLQATSPCIDTGTATGAPATDILGVARPFGAGVDMGAYEFNGPWILGGIVINDDARTTTNPAVTLSLNWTPLAGSPVTRMRFSDDGAHWTLWEPLAAVRPYTLPGPDGYNTVRIQFRDGLGNLSDRLNDYILLDTTPPTGTIVINGGASSTKDPNVTLSLTWSDGTGSGVSRMRFSDDGATWTPWEMLKATLPHTLPLPPGGHQTVRVQYRDAAGNYSARYSDYIRLDAP